MTTQSDRISNPEAHRLNYLQIVIQTAAPEDLKKAVVDLFKDETSVDSLVEVIFRHLSDEKLGDELKELLEVLKKLMSELISFACRYRDAEMKSILEKEYLVLINDAIGRKVYQDALRKGTLNEVLALVSQ